MSDREWCFDTNSRGYDFTYCRGKHVILPELPELPPFHHYLKKENIPYYPECVFNVANVSHVTEISGLQGIFKDGGFRGSDNYLWWGLSVTGNDMVNAENDFLNRQEFSRCSPNEMPFLKKFTTSPAFKSESRYGNFRFTFTLRELLNIYSKQYCNSTSPILRVLDTKLYKKEIQYSVLVHPRSITQYRGRNRRLPIYASDKHLCGYRKGKMSWRCQSPSDHYTHYLEVDYKEGEVYAVPLRRTEYYVWDNVAVAFHMEEDWKLSLSHRQLFKHLSVCEVAPKNLLKESEMSVQEALEEVENLKKTYL